VARTTPPDATLLTFLHDQPALEFYLERPIERGGSEARLRGRLASREPVYVVLREKDFETRRGIFRRRVVRTENYMHPGMTMVLATNQDELSRSPLHEGPRDGGR
jgi:hypothetical protein